MNHRFCVTLLIFLLIFSFYGLTCFADTPTPGTNAVTEVVSGRNQNTRVWQTTHIENAVDLVTGLPTGTQNTTYPIYYERADGLCYQDTANNWQVSVESIQSTQDGTYQALQGPYQVKFTGSMSASFPVTYTANGDILRMGLRSIGFYNMQTNTLQTLQVVSQSYPVLKGNTLTYPGVFPGIDVQYQYLRGSFEQRLILQNNSSLPSPAIFNMDSTVYLVSITEIDTSSVSCSITNSAGESLTNSFLSGENQSLYFTDSSTGNTICQFVVSQAFDSQNSGLPLNMYKQLYQADGHLYLLEGVPFSWVQSSQYPITLDYQTLTNTTIASNEVWKSGNTYYLSGPFTVGSPWSLAIEGGTVIKFSEGAEIVVQTASKIIAKGDKFNYIMFTSANDNSVGATISGYSTATPAPGDYTTAIYFQPTSSTASWIEYCKIAYAQYGLKIQTQLNNPVENNIIRLCSVADVWINNGSSNGVTLLNNLILGPAAYGIYGYNTTTTAYINALNNTVDGVDTSIYAYATISTGTYLSCKNNLITNGAFGLYAGNSTFFGTHLYNKFYDVATPWFGVIKTTGENTIQTGSLPVYSSSPNGSYYLNHNLTMSETFLGDSAASVYGLDTKTTETAILILSDITNSPTWSLVERDTYNDTKSLNGCEYIGYHYDPVDVIIGNSASNYSIAVSGNGNTLTIDSGVVVSFYRDSTDTGGELNNEATLTAIGQPGNEIQFTSIFATGSLHAMPLRGGLDSNDYFAIVLSPTSNPASNIQYCQFSYAQYGLDEEASLNIDKPIQNNIFKNNICGIYFDSSSAIIANVVNNLFIDNGYGIDLVVAGSQPPIPTMTNYLQSNTFYGNGTGVLLANEDSLTLRLENNLFVGNYIGVTNSEGACTVETRNNLYWDNGQNTNGVPLNTTGGDNADITGSNPMLVHQTQLSSTTFLSSTTHDGFYLAQNSGDASRFPLQISSVSGISGSFANTPPNGVKITVSSYTNGLSGSVQLGYATTLNGGSWSYTSTGSGLGNILITLNAGANGWTISSTDSITLLFGNDSIRVYLPQLSLYESQVRYWAALDGSIYYSTPGPTGIYEDAWYAMEYDSSGLVRSAYSAGGRSASVDKGSVKVTTINSTTYRYTTMASLGNTNTNGTSDNSSTYRLIPATLSTSTIDPIGRLDIGYHYNGNVVYTIDMVTAFIYQPSGRLYTYSPYTDYFDDTYQNAPYPNYKNDIELRKSISGKYNSMSLNPTEILTMTGIGPLVNSSIPTSRNYIGLGYHIYNTPILAAFDEISSHPYSEWDGDLTYSLGPYFNYSGLAASPTGQVFSMLQGFNTYQVSYDNYTIMEFMYIYRYDDSSNSWTKIVTLETTEYEPGGLTIQGADIAVDTANLWITVSSIGSPYNFIGVTLLPLNTLPQTINLGSFTPVQYETTYAYPVKITYDASTGWGRILYNDQDDSNNMHAMGVNIVAGSPHLARDTVAALNAVGGGIDPYNYEIVYNPNDPTGGILRAYAVYNINDNTEYSHLDASDSLHDLWSSYSNTFADDYAYGRQNVTYRYDGSALVAWSSSRDDVPSEGGYSDGFMHTNAGGIPIFFNDGGFYLDVKTNTINHRDILATWHEFTDPANTNDFSGVVVCQELYP